MLSIQSINQYYGESHILRGLDLELPAGQCTCLMGRNGVGKTTLLNCVMGLIPNRNGKIEFQGDDISALPTEVRVTRGLGLVPQGREIFPTLTVEENLRVAMSALGKAHATIPDHVLTLFPVLKDMLRRRGGDLSGGQQQQLAIARALVLEPRILLLDEPTEGIQPNIVALIGDVLRQLVADGLTVLLVEQKLPFARANADRFYIIDRGSNVVDGPIAALDDETAQLHLSV